MSPNPSDTDKNASGFRKAPDLSNPGTWERPTVEDVIEFAKAASADPKVWAVCVRAGKFPEENDGFLTDEEQGALSQFRIDYALERKMDPTGFGAASSILYKFAAGSIDNLDCNEAVDEIKTHPFVRR
ncbi:MAG: hypothetical protein H7Z12_07335 [Rhodospirillaceae bacterium]|nr:hypothetical protein [Rhodospirillales bacterium]